MGGLLLQAHHVLDHTWKASKLQLGLAVGAYKACRLPICGYCMVLPSDSTEWGRLPSELTEDGTAYLELCGLRGEDIWCAVAAAELALSCLPLAPLVQRTRAYRKRIRDVHREGSLADQKQGTAMVGRERWVVYLAATVGHKKSWQGK